MAIQFGEVFSMLLKKVSGALLGASFLTSIAGMAHAAVNVIDESSVPGGDFGTFREPFLLDPGVDGVRGTVNTAVELSNFGRASDGFVFTDLPNGSRQYNYSITSVDGTLFTFFAFVRDENGLSTSLFSVNLQPTVPSVSGTFVTPADFQGTFLAAIEWEGSTPDIATYSLELDTSEVPLPAAGILMAAGLGSLGAASARRKAKRRK